jgi:iron complex transport system substrate-binding protein
MKFKSFLGDAFDFSSVVINIVLLGLLFLFAGCSDSKLPADIPNNSRSDLGNKAPTLRIISTVPSVSETLFELGLGDCVVGASDYCKYPEEILSVLKIGSLHEYNLEAIVELTPDFVVVLKENDVLPQKLSALGIETISVDHSTLEGVLESFEVIANRVEESAPGTSEHARTICQEMNEQISSIRASVADKVKVKTLVSIYRTVGLGKIGEVYVAGKNPYFDSVLEIVGATNVASELQAFSPRITAEGILELNPEAILDLSTDGVTYEGEELKTKKEERIADWESLGDSLDAVKNNRIYPIFADYATIPGPRTVLFLEELADILHPERTQEEE